VALSDSRGAADLQIYLSRQIHFDTKFPTSRGVFFYISPNSDKEGNPVLRVCALNDAHFIFLYSDGVRFAIDRKGREIWGDWPDGYSLEDACTYLIGPVIAFVLRLRGAVCLHASSIAIGGRAIVLVGESGAGKSTTAAAFARLGFPILSDDVAVLSGQGGRFLVQPGHPRINLWADSVEELFGSKDALPRISPTWDKRYLALGGDAHRFQAAPLPLGAVFVLGERADTVTVPIAGEFGANEALMTLIANTYVNYLLDAEMRRRDFETLSRVAANVPVRRIRPAGDCSKVFELCEAIFAGARELESWDMTDTAMKAR